VSAIGTLARVPRAAFDFANVILTIPDASIGQTPREVVWTHRGTTLYRYRSSRREHGVLGLVKTLALEGAPYGISATAVCPGYVRTPLVEGQIAAQAKAHGLTEDRVLEEVILAPQAVKRLIEPDEVAATVAFLLGPDGRAFTGAPVIMDHGWSAS
jgi:NAD(P)-dependent dehydrogenase (short-subunit alcohol dehydrogenase family)